MLISLNKWNWLRIFLKIAYGEKLIYWKDICCRYTLELPQCVPTAYVTKNKEENYLQIYIFQVSCPLSLPLLNTPKCQSVLKFLSFYCQLFIFAWQLHVHLQILVHELPVLSSHSKRRPDIRFQDRSLLNAGLQYFLPSLSYHLSFRSLFCLALSGHLGQVLLYLSLRFFSSPLSFPCVLLPWDSLVDSWSNWRILSSITMVLLHFGHCIELAVDFCGL